MDQKHLGRSLEHLGLDGRLSLVLSEDNHLTLVEGEAGFQAWVTAGVSSAPGL